MLSLQLICESESDISSAPSISSQPSNSNPDSFEVDAGINMIVSRKGQLLMRCPPCWVGGEAKAVSLSNINQIMIGPLVQLQFSAKIAPNRLEIAVSLVGIH